MKLILRIHFATLSTVPLERVSDSTIRMYRIRFVYEIADASVWLHLKLGHFWPQNASCSMSIVQREQRESQLRAFTCAFSVRHSHAAIPSHASPGKFADCFNNRKRASLMKRANRNGETGKLQLAAAIKFVA